jgi:hypothetical protein
MAWPDAQRSRPVNSDIRKTMLAARACRDRAVQRRFWAGRLIGTNWAPYGARPGRQAPECPFLRAGLRADRRSELSVASSRVN